MSHPTLIRFADVRGQDRTRAFLQTAVANEHLAHALLFAGPDGIGKRSIALALAAWMSCEERDGADDACGECPSCRQIPVGTHPDLMVVSLAAGKKEIGVDRARDLKRFTQLRPMRAASKVVIVDDAHLLTVAAQNALLKTLEEPPNRSLIILVASTPDALLTTVRSRCQRVQFVPLAEATVVELLVAQGIAEADAALLASLAEGSVGRALSLRDSVLGGHRAQLEQLLAGVGGARYPALMQLADALGKPESELASKLELLLAQYRNEAVEHLEDAPRRVAALRRADLVREAWQTVRYRNPNRQLLIESLLLRLAAV